MPLRWPRFTGAGLQRAAEVDDPAGLGDLDRPEAEMAVKADGLHVSATTQTCTPAAPARAAAAEKVSISLRP